MFVDDIERLRPQRVERLAAVEEGRGVVVGEAAWVLLQHAFGAGEADERLVAVDRRVPGLDVLEGRQLGQVDVRAERRRPLRGDAPGPLRRLHVPAQIGEVTGREGGGDADHYPLR